MKHRNELQISVIQVTQAVEGALGVRWKGQRRIGRSVTAADAECLHSGAWSEARSVAMCGEPAPESRERNVGTRSFVNRPKRTSGSHFSGS